MRVKFLMCLGSLILGLFVTESQAQEDVYVDLSVLNDLGSVGDPIMHSEPLFPVIKKSVHEFPEIKTIAPKKVSSPKTAPQKVVSTKVEQPETRKLKIKQTEVSKKEITKVNEVIAIPTKPNDINLPAQSNTIFGVEEVVVEKPVASAPIVDIVAEPIEAPRKFVAAVKTDGTQSILPNEEQSAMPESVVQEIKPDTVVIPTAPVVSEAPAVVDVKEELAPQGGQISDTIVIEKKKIEPLILVGAESVMNVGGVSKQIIFDNDANELSPSNQEKVSSIIAGFEDAKTNKIAILAYNHDNGEDVFKKKRQSLNRAIEVRSYLLNKGYKNFSIKVINITDDASKGNTVEIEEIK